MNLSQASEPLRAAGFTGEFRVALLRDDAASTVKAAAVAAMRDTVSAFAHRGADSVIVFPIMIAEGPLTWTEIPSHLAGLPVVLATVRGRTVFASGQTASCAASMGASGCAGR